MHRGSESAGQIYEMEFSKYGTMQEYQGLHHGIPYDWQTKYNLSVVEGCIKGLWTSDYERQARTEKGVEFPSMEGALMSISFLIFAVFLIKLVQVCSWDTQDISV
jgi:hypothetical protein